MTNRATSSAGVVGPSVVVWNILETIFGASALGFFLVYWFTLAHYGESRPTAADAKTGRIYPLNNHGLLVYLNSTESHRQHLLLWCAAVCFLSTISIGVLAKSRRSGLS